MAMKFRNLFFMLPPLWAAISNDRRRLAESTQRSIRRFSHQELQTFFRVRRNMQNFFHQTVDFIRANVLQFELGFLGLGQKFWIFEGRFEGRAQNFDAVFWHAGRHDPGTLELILIDPSVVEPNAIVAALRFDIITS
jgi:hypothetical protein